MEWQSVTLSLDDISAGAHNQLKREFATSFWLSGAPRSARMLARSMGDTHLAFYFSPGAVTIFDIGLSRWSAAPCEAPVDGDLTLVVGHEEPTLQA